MCMTKSVRHVRDEGCQRCQKSTNQLLHVQYENNLGVEGIKILAESGGVFEKMLRLKALYMVSVPEFNFK